MVYKEEVTEHEKLSASEKLSNTMLSYIVSQEKFNRKLNILVWLELCALFIFIIGSAYLIFKPKTATQIDINFIDKATEKLNERSFFLNKRDSAISERERLLVILKSHQDSAVAGMMANIFKQDSLAKLKNVIKADHVNTNTINTVNTKTVNVKK